LVRFIHPITNFGSGELDTNLFGRIDVNEYKTGLSKSQNCLLTGIGSATKRIGSKMGPLIGSSVPVGPSQPQVYIDSVVLENGDSVVLEWSSIFDFRVLDSNLNTIPITYAGKASVENPFVNGLDKTKYSVAAYGNYVFVAHYSGEMEPCYIRFDSAGAVISYFPFDSFYGSAFLDPNGDESKTMRITDGTNVNGLYNLQANFVAFLPNHVGSQIRISGIAYAGNSSRYTAENYVITQYIDSQNVKVQSFSQTRYQWGSTMLNISGPQDSGLPSVTATSRSFSEWSFSAFSKVVGWPKIVTTFEGRLLFAGTKSKPNTIFASKINDPFFMMNVRFPNSDSHEYVSSFTLDGDVNTHRIHWNFYNGPVLTTDPYTFTVASKDGAAITFFEQSRFGAIGTLTSQYLMDGDGSVISQLNVGIRQFSSKSSSPLLAVALDNTVFYSDNTGTRVYMYLYNETNGSYISKEVSLLYGKFSEDNRIVSMAFSREFGAIMCVTQKGDIVALRYSQESGVLGFTKFYTHTPSSKVISYAAINSPNVPDAGIAVIQTGGFFKYVVFKFNVLNISVPFQLFQELNKLDYLDKLVILTDINTGLLTAMNQYEGEDLVVYGVLPSGQLEITQYDEYDGEFLLTLPNVYTDIAFGSRYALEIATMPIEAGQAYATAQMGQKRIDQALIRTSDCAQIKIGTDGYNYELVPISDNRGVFEMIGNPEFDHIVYIRHDDIGPCTINNITLRGVNNDA
jgi:hypothetical protein